MTENQLNYRIDSHLISTNKHQEANISELKLKLERIYKLLPATNTLYWEYDTQNRVVRTFNNTFNHLLYAIPPILTIRDILTYIQKNDRIRFFTLFKKAFTEHTGFTTEFSSFINNDTHHFNLICQIEIEANKEICYGFLQDISITKETLHLLKEQATWFKKLLNNAPDGIFIVEENGNIIDCNKKICDLLQTKKTKLISIIYTSIDTNFLNAIKELNTHNNAKRDHFQYDTKIELAEISLFAEISISRISTIENNFYILFCRDLSSKIEVMNRLQESDEKFKALSENAHIPMFIIQDNRYVYANKALSDKIGYSIEEIINKVTPQDIIKEEENISDIINKRLSQTLPTGNIFKVLHKLGNTIFAQIYSAPIIYNGKPALIGTALDLTERKQIEERLIAARNYAEESDKLKSSFLANMSHEIRTPLNTIVGFSQLLETDELPLEKRQRYIALINSNSQQLMNLISDIIDVAKIESGLLRVYTEPLRINSLLQHSYDVFSNELRIINKSQIKLILEIPPKTDNLLFETDITRLNQIINNLLSNAIKFTLSGSITFGYTIEQNKIVFFVKDTGIGISPQKQKIIFDQFRQADESTTRKFGGTGLGLAICKKLTQILYGDIWVESEKDIGSTFKFFLPLIVPEIIDKKINESQTLKEIDFSNYSILLIDDVEIVHQFLGEVAKKINIKMYSAFSGKEAIEIAQKHTDIDIVFTDIQMEHMNGIDCMRELRNILIDTPIIAQTAYALSDDKEKFMEAGFDDYISKPIIFDTFIETLKRNLTK